MDDGSEMMEAAEAEAPELRARLAGTLDALDHRLHDMVDVEVQVRKHAPTLLLAGAGAVVVLGGALAVRALLERRRRKNLNRERWRALKRFWYEPTRFGS